MAPRVLDSDEPALDMRVATRHTHCDGLLCPQIWLSQKKPAGLKLDAHASNTLFLTYQPLIVEKLSPAL